MTSDKVILTPELASQRLDALGQPEHLEPRKVYYDYEAASRRTDLGGSVQLSFHCDKKLARQIERYAARWDMNRAEAIRVLIETGLDHA